ncbi:MAG: enoyl-CoA hydratase/isomerase family protein [Chloroflexi bacterium]|nr:enoyl-CoA hydratase/isomerase family protein [Chloroflexota bacterium]MBV9132194.1 enoyl-CoA hydratase/isomerase family protein [Chloroflexota bacterium]MBV9893113.1 enoyl-CoA hydratase/isomerase family protein [Chloroflexota bacterium]
MSLVETERRDGIFLIRMNRPERLNALGVELRTALAQAWCEFRDSRELEVAIYTGTGRAFCVGEDMKESVERGTVGSGSARGPMPENPYMTGEIQKPIIAAINGFAMGGGFMLAEQADLRVAVHHAVFEMSEAKRWLLGGFNHGYIGGLSHTVATEMAFAFRFDADRMYELGFLNRIVDDDQLLSTSYEMAEHLMTLPPAARVNTLMMMRAMRPRVPEELQTLAARLREHGAKSDLMESRRAFAEKRKPNFIGWDNPEDRYSTPTLESLRTLEAATSKRGD